MTSKNSIRVAAIVTIRPRGDDKELLLVRSDGSPLYGFPGGKLEANETPVEALTREIAEEINTEAVNPQQVATLEGYTPDGREMTMYLYHGTLKDKPVIGAEIREMIWMTYDELVAADATMTRMTMEKALPYLKKLLVAAS